jgi:hypothetical protein
MVVGMPWSPTVTYNDSKASYWAKQSKLDGTIETASTGAQPNCWRCQIRFTRTTPVGTREDVATNTLHIAKNPGAGVRTRGVTSELAALEAYLDTFYGSWQSRASTQFSVSEYRWFNVDSDDPLSDKGYPLHGPPVRATGKANAGLLAASRLPDQLAVALTLLTCSRKHWGRFYLPGLGVAQYDSTYGRVTTAAADALSLALRTLVNNLAGAAGGVYELGVWSPTGLAWLNTTSVQCDDVPDVIRRRRPKQAAYRKVYTS